MQTLFSTKDAAAHIGKSESWLNKSRMSGSGPVYLKLGGGVRYALTDLNAWLAGNRRTAQSMTTRMTTSVQRPSPPSPQHT